MEDYEFTVELFKTESEANARDKELGARFSCDTYYGQAIKTADGLYGFPVWGGSLEVTDSENTRKIKADRFYELLEEVDQRAAEDTDG